MTDRAVITEITTTPLKGDHFRMQCVDMCDSHATLEVVMDTDVHLIINIGSGGLAEYDSISTSEMIEEVEGLVIAVVAGRVKESLRLDAKGQVRKSVVSALVDGRVIKFRYSSWPVKGSVTRVDKQYLPYSKF